MFRSPARAFAFDERDRRMERLLVRSFVAFVRGGNPSVEGVLLWPQTTKEHPMRYLRLTDPDRPRVEDLWMLDRLKFWLQLMEKYVDYNLIRGAPNPEEYVRDFREQEHARRDEL